MSTWDYSAFWQECITQIQNEFEAKKRSQEFDLWFSSLEYTGSKDSVVVLAVPSKFVQDNFISRGYAAAVQNKLYELSGKSINIEFTIKPAARQKPAAEQSKNKVNENGRFSQNAASSPNVQNTQGEQSGQSTAKKSIPIYAKIIPLTLLLWAKTIRLHTMPQLPFQKTREEHITRYLFTAASVWEKHI